MDFRDEQLQRQQEIMVHAPVEQEELQEGQNFLENPQQVQEIQQEPVLQQAPVHLPEEEQQQQMSRKEQKAQLRRQEKERNEIEKQRIKHEKDIAKARSQIDKTVAEIRKKQKSGIPGIDMTLSESHVCEEKVERLERMIVTKIKDVRQATEYLNKVKELQDMAQKQDQLIQGIRMRTIQAPIYIKDVMKKELPEGMLEAVTESIIQEQEMIADNPFQTKYDDLQRQIFVTDEELKQAEREDQNQVEAYEQRLKEIMQSSPEITRERARDQYLNETLCPTLKNFDQARKKDSDDIKKGGQEEEAYNVMKYANEDLKEELEQDRRGPLTREEADALITEYLQDYMNQPNSFQIRVPDCDIMKAIISSGRFKTQMETRTSLGGVDDVETRKRFTQRKFGTDINTLPDDMYEIYGYLSHGDLVKESNAATPPSLGKPEGPGSHIGMAMAQYGHVIVTLKKDRLKNRTTATIGDSLTGTYMTNAAWLDRMDLQSVDVNQRSDLIKDAYHYKKVKEAKSEKISEFLDYEKVMKARQICYTELQFHGQVTIDDIESVTLLTNIDPKMEGKEEPATKDARKIETEMPKDLQEMLRLHGIKAQIIKRGKLYEL